jgi:V8-like Glu-specific endopeptidase
VLSLFNNVVVGPRGQVFNNVILTEKISVPGDSGAPVVDKATNKLIGFIIGGNDECSAVLPFYNLFLNRNFEINT